MFVYLIAKIFSQIFNPIHLQVYFKDTQNVISNPNAIVRSKNTERAWEYALQISVAQSFALLRTWFHFMENWWICLKNYHRTN